MNPPSRVFMDFGRRIARRIYVSGSTGSPLLNASTQLEMESFTPCIDVTRLTHSSFASEWFPSKNCIAPEPRGLQYTSKSQARILMGALFGSCSGVSAFMPSPPFAYTPATPTKGCFSRRQSERQCRQEAGKHMRTRHARGRAAAAAHRRLPHARLRQHRRRGGQRRRGGKQG